MSSHRHWSHFRPTQMLQITRHWTLNLTLYLLVKRKGMLTDDNIFFKDILEETFKMLVLHHIVCDKSHFYLLMKCKCMGDNYKILFSPQPKKSF